MNIDDAAYPDLELVKDDFAEGEHDKLNAELSPFFGTQPDNIATNGPLMLSVIIQQLGDRATTQFESFDDRFGLIEREPRLRNMLLQACQNASFSLVRRLKILHKELAWDKPSKSYSLPPPKCTRAARLAWNCEYHGDYHRIMLQNINAMKRSPDYANSVALIQSSGSGKSRMVDEMAKLVFTIPCNIRNPDESDGGAYPPEDYHVWKYFCEMLKVDGVDHIMARTALFFQTLFSEVTAQVNLIFSTQKELSPGNLAQQWREHLLGRERSQMYRRIVEACNKVISEGIPDQILDRLNNKLIELLTALDSTCVFRGSNDVKVMLYFDEAHELYGAIGYDKPRKTLYDIVYSTLNHLKNHSVFAVFISTELPPTFLTPPALMDEQQNTQKIQAVITETAFDCHPSFPLKQGELNLKQLGELSFIACFGRPLFWTMLTHDKEGKGTTALLDDMMNLARMKLLYDNGIWKSRHSNTALLAILDVLITIDYEPRQKLVRELGIEMISSHMRTAFSIPDHRLYIHSGYPSEPFIAEAASCQMYHYMQNHMSFTIANIFRDNLDTSLIDAGQSREMVMRILLRKAYMDAVIAEQQVEPDTSPNFSQGCSFVGFVKALFAERFRASVLECKPDNKAVSSNALEVTFQDAVVRFTHFVRAVDSSLITTRGMVIAFLRGSAIISHSHTEGIDVAVPILLHKDHKIEEASMSAMLVRVQRQRHSGSANAYLIDAKELGFFPMGLAEDTRPYVTLVAKLDVKHPPCSTSNAAAGQSDTRTSADIVSKPMEKHPRYSIRTYGCTDQAWNVIRSDELAEYTHILSTVNSWPDHPRQIQGSPQLARRMSTFWCQDAVHFLDEAPEPIPQRHDPVEVGVYEDSEESMVVDEGA